MQLDDKPDKIVLPFAETGGKNTIPVASQIGVKPGAASFADGFPPLTRTPLAAGGVPPSGLDMNGILNQISGISKWMSSGAGFTYDSAFANDPNVNGYPMGARVARSDGAGYWLNTADNNTSAPEEAGADAAGWVPDTTNGVATIAMSSTNVTLTPMQWGCPVIMLTGTLTANVNLIFPALSGQWAVNNSCAGAFSVTCKTSAGAGVTIPPGTIAPVYSNGSNVYSSVTSSCSLKSVTPFTGALSGVPAHVGGAVYGYSTTDNSYSIPNSTSNNIQVGACIKIWNFGASEMAVARQGDDQLQSPGGSYTNTLLVPEGSQVDFIYTGSKIWQANGVGVMSNSRMFKKSLTSPGYQYLPTGLIIQWGTAPLIPANGSFVVNLQVTYPNELLLAMCGNSFSGPSATVTSTVGVRYDSNSSFTIFSQGGSQPNCPWIAIGY